jgi:hypothetical protein
MANINPEQFPGDPTRAATAIYQEVRANSKRHRMILGSEAYRQIGAKLNALQSEFELSRDLAFSTDYPDAGPGVLRREIHTAWLSLFGRAAAAVQVASSGNGPTPATS